MEKKYQPLLFTLLLLLTISCNYSGSDKEETEYISIADPLLTVHYIDVGQGDATFLEGPDFNILIDAGRHNGTEVLDYLTELDIDKIDLLVGTHPHADHIGQFPLTLSNFEVLEVWLSGDLHTTRTFERAIDAILASDASYNEPRAGQVYNIGSAVIEVLNPVDIIDNFHEGCLAIRISFGEISFMFTGDIEKKTELEIVDRHQSIESNILQLGHHGSRTSTSSGFLKAVRPQIAVYSAGRGNPYNHPHTETLNLLEKHHITVFGTDRNGTIRVITDGFTFSVGTDKNIREPYSNFLLN